MTNDFLRDNPPPISVIRQEKDFLLKKLYLTAFSGATYDITEHRIDFFYYEDLFMGAITGTLDLLDAIDYPQLMPLIGEETLTVVLGRQDEGGQFQEGELLPDLELKFRVYKVSGRQIQNEKVQNYRLHLISEEFIKNLKTKIYHGWKSKKYSDMVAEVYARYIQIDKPITIEPTKYEQDFTASNLSPFEFFNMLAARSISDADGSESFTFYQDREGFHFKSIGSLLLGATQEIYSNAPHQILIPSTGRFAAKDLPIDIDIKNIEHYFWNNQHDILKNIESGMYAQNLTTVDIVRQKFEFLDFDLNSEYESFPHVDKERFFTDSLDALSSPKAHTKLMSTNKDHDIVPHIVARDATIKPYKLEEYAMRRTSHMNQFNNFRLGLTVSGDPRRKVGDIIQFDLPQVTGDVHENSPQELDRYFQGKYLVISIKHHLAQGAYTMEMEIMKDSFFKPIEHINPLEKYKDIF